MKAMILAAGRGQRLRPLTDSLPKPLVPLGDKPLIYYLIDRLKHAGITSLVINTAYLAEKIVALLGDGSRFGVEIEYSPEPYPGLETGGGVVNALPLLGNEPFWVINGDIYTDFDFSLATLADDKMAHWFLVNNPPHNPEGDFAVEQGCLAEKGSPRYTFAGVALYRPECFAGLAPGRFSLVPHIRKLSQKQQVAAEVYRGVWFDIGSPEQLAVAEADLLR